jgi:DNA-binding response OmpR family regulator
MREVWQTDYLGDTRTLDVHICWLRRKVEEDPARPRLILTRRGVGYELNVPAAAG